MGLFRDSRDRRDLSLKVCWTLAVWLMTQQLGCDVNEADEAEQRRLERHPPDNFGSREFCRAIPPQSKLLPALAVCIWATLELLERYNENAIFEREKRPASRERRPASRNPIEPADTLQRPWLLPPRGLNGKAFNGPPTVRCERERGCAQHSGHRMRHPSLDRPPPPRVLSRPGRRP